MVCAHVWRDNPRALARGLSTIQVHNPTLHITEYLVLKIGYLWVVVQYNISALQRQGND